MIVYFGIIVLKRFNNYSSISEVIICFKSLCIVFRNVLVDVLLV